jgi:hypothetical protein
MIMTYVDKKRGRSIDFHFRLHRELEEKLEKYRELKHHKSLSQTFRYFLRLGMQSSELLDELKENPSKKDTIIKEWESALKSMICGDAVQDELDKISDSDLETVVMMGYSELAQRKRGLKQQEFRAMENKINSHVESYMDDRISGEQQSK